MKKVVAACIEKILEFDTEAERLAYLENLKDKGTRFLIISMQDYDAINKYRIRIREGYNKSPMIED